MANQFLVEIHQYLQTKIIDSRRNKLEAEQRGESDVVHYYEGTLRELLELRDYVSQSFDLATQKY